MKDHEKRLAEWCTATGLKKSNATLKKAIGWQNKFTTPSGFDHTIVLYFPPKKIYVVITEPYANSSFEAVSVVKDDIEKMQVSIVVCERGAGIWNPPHTIPVIIGVEDHRDLLVQFANCLPKIKDA